ncbi:MAG: aspartyl beta-hydroxylase [Erysipelotrichia bacterium]|nr:aspartyl beta-hydroxylase [Erysipelotrichia bacterium]NCC54451.1 aspartyl beta-hydroxylase [Erysipelotrichia bacterium]
MLDNLSEDVKKILLAGIGAVALSVEKSKDVIDELVDKGALTIEQGKVLNEELKHDLKEKLACKKENVDLVSKKIEGFSKEELEALKAKIDTLQNQDGKEDAK